MVDTSGLEFKFCIESIEPYWLRILNVELLANDETILAHRAMSFRTHCADKLRDLSSNCHVDGN